MAPTYKNNTQIQKDIKIAKNWTYCEQDNCFICPNGRKVAFKKYQNKKDPSGYEQSFKIYECEDCSHCPLKSKCTKVKGNCKIITIKGYVGCM
ncbi:transposase [Aeribacillus sp. FSL k6-2211]|uniref:transposase n=1 Tax=unclassified Aeribacillus TaxID=2640495 RepID=UPI00403F15A2